MYANFHGEDGYLLPIVGKEHTALTQSGMRHKSLTLLGAIPALVPAWSGIGLESFRRIADKPQ
jgi:hypothetical protein